MIQLAHRIVLTERCNMKCPHCFNADQRAAAVDMDLEKLFRFWIFNKPYLQRAELKIMGGEPTIHPDFKRFCEVGISMFDVINCFTNGTNLDFITHPDIMAATWTGKMNYTFNGFTFKPKSKVWNEYGKYFKLVSVHFVIPAVTFNTPLKKFTARVKAAARDLYPGQAQFIFSADTGVDLFQPTELKYYRQTYMSALAEVVPHVVKAGYKYDFDHYLPRCFWTDQMLNELHERHIDLPHLANTHCCDTILGLLDTNFDLWYCNQTRIKVGNVFKNNQPRHMQEILRMIKHMPELKCSKLCKANSRCANCPAVSTCKAACWYENAIKER